MMAEMMATKTVATMAAPTVEMMAASWVEMMVVRSVVQLGIEMVGRTEAISVAMMVAEMVGI